MEQLHSPPAFDWQTSIGRNLYTADNQRVGIVEAIRTDPETGKTVLLVTTQSRFGLYKSLCVPAETIGIISRFRLMLDLSSNRVPFDDWQQVDDSECLPA